MHKHIVAHAYRTSLPFAELGYSPGLTPEAESKCQSGTTHMKEVIVSLVEWIALPCIQRPTLLSKQRLHTSIKQVFRIHDGAQTLPSSKRNTLRLETKVPYIYVPHRKGGYVYQGRKAQAPYQTSIRLAIGCSTHFCNSLYIQAWHLQREVDLVSDASGAWHKCPNEIPVWKAPLARHVHNLHKFGFA
eukprot:1158863-Pelagomonas_calceolata.AAC.1